MEATALCQSGESTGLKPPQRTFNPIGRFGFPDFEIHYISVLLIPQQLCALILDLFKLAL
jgi:hypothetical protein